MRTTLATAPLTDARLVELSRDGDRDAFARIVERYQALICALTYSACGDLLGGIMGRLQCNTATYSDYTPRRSLRKTHENPLRDQKDP